MEKIDFENWNPLEEAFRNLGFNRYDVGPGAQLGKKLQPANSEAHFKAKREKHSNAPCLLVRNAPKSLTVGSLFNMCSRYGNVSDCFFVHRSKLFVVKFPSVADMDSVLKALQNSSYGFHVQVSGNATTQRNKFCEKIEETVEQTTSSDNLTKFDIKETISNNLEGKLVRSSKYPKRLNRIYASIVDEAAYECSESLLQKNDPDRRYLLTDDAHHLERSNVLPSGSEYTLNDIIYNNGAAYKFMPEEIKTNLEKLREKSTGYYDKQKQTFAFCSNPESVWLKDENCKQCQCTCDTMCSRCEEYFCSQDCLLNGWSNHRTECAAMYKKLLDSKELQLEEITFPLKEMPDSKDLVVITAIKTSNFIFIRSRDPKVDAAYIKILTEVQNAAEILTPLKSTPQCGQIVLTVFKNDLYSRAMLLNVKDLLKILIVHIDYGNIELKNISELYKAPDYIANRPRYAICVALKNLPFRYMNEELRYFMYKHLEETDFRIEYDKDGDLLPNKFYQVELFNSKTNRSFNEMVRYYCTPVEPAPSRTKLTFIEELCCQPLPCGNNIELVIMDNTSLKFGVISCTTSVGCREIDQFNRDIRYYAENLADEPYTPRCKEVCVAKYRDNKWYRGVCLQVLGDGYPKIFFPDYGNIEPIRVEKIRAYPSVFTFPVFTHECRIKGLPSDFSDELVHELKNLLRISHILKCESVTKYQNQSDVFEISLPNVMRKLAAKGLVLEEHDQKAEDEEKLESKIKIYE